MQIFLLNTSNFTEWCLLNLGEEAVGTAANANIFTEHVKHMDGTV